MDSQTAIDLGRQAILQILVIGGPLLVAVLLIGLIVSVFQTIANIQDQTVAFIPKLVVTVLAISLSLPWLIGKITDYGEATIGGAGQNAVDRSMALPQSSPVIERNKNPLVAGKTVESEFPENRPATRTY